MAILDSGLIFWATLTWQFNIYNCLSVRSRIFFANTYTVFACDLALKRRSRSCYWPPIPATNISCRVHYSASE